MKRNAVFDSQLHTKDWRLDSVLRQSLRNLQAPPRLGELRLKRLSAFLVNMSSLKLSWSKCNRMPLSLSYWYMMCESVVGVEIWLQNDRYMPHVTSKILWWITHILYLNIIDMFYNLNFEFNSGEKDFAGLIELEDELMFLGGSRKTCCTIIAAQLKNHPCQVLPTGFPSYLERKNDWLLWVIWK